MNLETKLYLSKTPSTWGNGEKKAFPNRTVSKMQIFFPNPLLHRVRWKAAAGCLFERWPIDCLRVCATCTGCVKYDFSPLDLLQIIEGKLMQGWKSLKTILVKKKKLILFGVFSEVVFVKTAFDKFLNNSPKCLMRFFCEFFGQPFKKGLFPFLYELRSFSNPDNPSFCPEVLG